MVSDALTLIDHPSLDEIAAGLRTWAERWPGRLQVEERGRSVEDRPVLLARVTDLSVSDEDKQVVLLTAHHAGPEITGCTGLLHLTRWLLSDDHVATRLRKALLVLVVPVVHPDFYQHFGQRYREFSTPDRPAHHDLEEFKRKLGFGDPYLDLTWDGPADAEKSPEAATIFDIAEEYEPDAAFDVHGVWFRGQGLFESTGFSFAGFDSHGYSRALIREMDGAAEKQGFLIMRPDEDAGRLKVHGPRGDATGHFYRTKDVVTVMSLLYHRYHTLAIMCEAAFDDSVVARARRFLEMALETWDHALYAGYDVNQLGGWNSMTLAAWGDTARNRRLSRVELWGKVGQLCYGLVEPQPVGHKMAAACATTRAGARRWLGEGAVSEVLERLSDHPDMDDAYLSRFLSGSIMRNFPSPGNISGSQGYDPSGGPDEPIRNGLSMRLYIPYRGARIVDPRIDGHPVMESKSHGYQVRHDPGTIVQFNIPPERVGEAHVVSCEYESSDTHRQGFRPEDWE